MITTQMFIDKAVATFVPYFVAPLVIGFLVGWAATRLWCKGAKP